MSKKYVIEIEDGEQCICINGECEHKYYTRVVPVADLEELTAEYVNENFGELQDDAYMRGINDHDKGVTSCEFCRYENAREKDEPCRNCSNSHINMFEPKVKDEKIEVGDEVHGIDRLQIVVIYINISGRRVSGFTNEGKWCSIPIEEAKKTGKHYDIKSILEDMQE